MKILLLFPMKDGQTGPAIKYAFNRLGHKVEVVDAKLSYNTSHSAALEFKPDMVFCSRTQALTEQVRSIRKDFKKAVVCMWNVDGREKIERWAHLFDLVRLCDLHFVVNFGSVKDWKRLNQNTHWLPQGLQSEIYGKPKKITQRDRDRYESDVTFAGDIGSRIHRQRREYIDAIKKAGIKLKLWNRYQGVWNEEHNKMVALTKINLGCTIYFGPGNGVSVRDYKIIGAGGFLLDLWRERIHSHFPLQDGKKLMDTYADPEDLVKKIRYYLEHEHERKEIAERGYDWVHAHARYIDRMKKVIEFVERMAK